MLTNLVVTVSTLLVTNTTERFSRHVDSFGAPPDCPTCAAAIVHWADDNPPKWKCVTTEIKERTTFSFVWHGENLSDYFDKSISTTNQFFQFQSVTNLIPVGPQKDTDWWNNGITAP